MKGLSGPFSRSHEIEHVSGVIRAAPIEHFQTGEILITTAEKR